MDVSRGSTTTLTVPLAEGTGAYTDRVTVTADTVPVADQAIPARQELGSAAMQRVGTVLIDDPFRAVQALPGVAANDDFRSDFSIRGVDFWHLGLSIDGVQTRVLLHAFEEVDDGGSMALLNSDILDRVTLSSGSYPQRFGDRSGAWLDATMREGSRAATGFRGAVSGTAASLLAEGPLGRAAKGSWLAFTRYSYIDWLLRRVVSDLDATFGFGDLQSKAVYDVTPRQRVEVMGIAGRARLEQPNEQDPERRGPRRGRHGARHRRVAIHHRAVGRAVAALLGGRPSVQQRQPAVGRIGRGMFRDLSYRSDVLWVPRRQSPSRRAARRSTCARRGASSNTRRRRSGRSPRRRRTISTSRRASPRASCTARSPPGGSPSRRASRRAFIDRGRDGRVAVAARPVGR